MKKSTKAILLSALVFPGAGHLYLKKYISAAGLVGVSSIALYYLITKSIEHAMQILDKIQSGTVPADAAAITDLVTQQVAGKEAQLLDLASVVIVICWIAGIAGAYWSGRAQDASE